MKSSHDKNVFFNMNIPRARFSSVIAGLISNIISLGALKPKHFLG